MFKVGDLVKCIRNSDIPKEWEVDKSLEIESIYEVIDIYYDRKHIKVKGLNIYYDPTRFELAEEEAV